MMQRVPNGSHDEIVEMDGVALAIPTDISSKEAVDHLFDQTLASFGTVDILVNNAGLISPMIHFLEADYEVVESHHLGQSDGDVFVLSPRCPYHGAQWGRSDHQHVERWCNRAYRAFAAYDASRGGIEAFTRARLALDLGPYNIRVNSLVPGSIDTTGMDEEARNYAGSIFPSARGRIERYGRNRAVFLASDDASYVTGHAVTGGHGGMLAQQRSATVDIHPPTKFPKARGLVEMTRTFSGWGGHRREHSQT
jgi:3-oxoacyl-[acyl-carrier protein] reductase